MSLLWFQVRSFRRFERTPSIDEVNASLWRSQFYQVAKTSRRPYIEDLSKTTMNIQHQNGVIEDSENVDIKMILEW